jgi:cytochrome d ubiquinol oxidase subunit II
MDLNVVWFVLIAVLFIGFFFLEGFDYGVGILLPFLGKDDAERRMLINTIGPFWDANEVWLITAGGAMFSGFYLALFLLLVALIVRGVAFEFRSKDEHPKWRSVWDWMIFVGSFVPALLWGVAMANLLRGLPINADMTYVGSFWDLLNPFALVAGLASLATFTLHGAAFLSLRTDGDVMARAQRAAMRLWIPALVLLFLFATMGYIVTDVFSSQLGVNPGPIPIGAAIALLAAGWFLRKGQSGWGFVLTGLTIILSVTTIFEALYPRVMVSSLNPDWSLTIYNASSSAYTLRVMTIIAAIFVPIVLIYQGWSYWVFRQRIGRETSLEY